MTAHPPAASALHTAKTVLGQSRKRSFVRLAIDSCLLTGLLALAAQLPGHAAPLPNGPHLFGEAQEANVPGSTYMLLQVQDNQVVGAFYQPSSSYDCFHGTVAQNELNLSVIDSYSQTAHPYRVALNTDQSPVADAAGTAVPVSVEGLHRINALSEMDQTILNTCLASYPY